MKRVQWDRRANEDLKAIAAYIAKESPRSARRVIEYIRNTALLLEASPELGRATDDGTREFVLTRYRYVLVYEIAGDEVCVLAVFHHAQKRR
ncbi:MAG: type II toxin-antitoxin system RelE/ParE family toxin [Pseudomonadota bacterium]